MIGKRNLPSLAELAALKSEAVEDALYAECTCAMTEASFWTCGVHGEGGTLSRLAEIANMEVEAQHGSGEALPFC